MKQEEIAVVNKVIDSLTIPGEWKAGECLEHYANHTIVHKSEKITITRYRLMPTRYGIRTEGTSGHISVCNDNSDRFGPKDENPKYQFKPDGKWIATLNRAFSELVDGLVGARYEKEKAERITALNAILG